MFRNLLQKIQGADIPMISSLLIFFIFFLLVTIYLIFIDKNHISYMSNLPLNGDNKVNKTQEN
jgi:hypothetical protein